MDKPSYCQWETHSNGVICKYCHIVRNSIRIRQCKTSKIKTQQATTCRYLKESIDPVKILCPTCTGRVLIKYPANICELEGKCLPTYFPRDLLLKHEDYTLCSHCLKKSLTVD